MANPILLHPRTAKADQPTQPTARASRHTLRRLYNGLTASYRGSHHRHSTDLYMDTDSHTQMPLPLHPIAGDVYASHPELIASPMPSPSYSGRGFLRHKRYSNATTIGSPYSVSATSASPSVIFISCPAR